MRRYRLIGALLVALLAACGGDSRPATPESLSAISPSPTQQDSPVPTSPADSRPTVLATAGAAAVSQSPSAGPILAAPSAGSSQTAGVFGTAGNSPRETLQKAVTLTLDYSFVDAGPAGHMTAHGFDCRWGTYPGHENEPFYLVRVVFNQIGTNLSKLRIAK